MAEPIAITVFKRKAHTQVGSIQNIRFSDIHCDSENGILIYGEEAGLISHIRFDRVSLRLQKETGYPQGFYDLRPNTGESFTEQALCHVRGHNATDVCFQDCIFSNENIEPTQSFLLENCRNFTAERESLC